MVSYEILHTVCVELLGQEGLNRIQTASCHMK